MNSPPYGPFDRLTVPSLSRDFDSGLAGLRSGLARFSLEPFGRLRVPSLSRDTLRSSMSKPARTRPACRQAVMSEAVGFANNPG